MSSSTRIVREERRRDVTWYELAHDRLVNPIRNDNRTWRSAHLSPFHDQATRWVSQRRPSDLLLADDQALEMERWEESHPSQLTDDEQDFLDASLEAQYERRSHVTQDGRGTNLAQMGWGVIFAHDTGAEVRKALESLLNLRKAQATELRPEYYRECTYQGVEGTRPAETVQQFLARHGAAIGTVQPETMPYYLLIVGSPASIPFAVQYELDLQYAVGRLYFDTPTEYLNYARSVVGAETSTAPLARRAAFFGPAHPNDRATQLTTDHLVQPLLRQLQSRFGGWTLQDRLRDQATKAALRDLLAGKERPDLLFAVGHSLALPPASADYLDRQGALVCQDWPGPGSGPGAILPAFTFGGDDLPTDATFQGMIAFLAVDYGAGTPDKDEFAEIRKIPAEAGGRAFLARLAQRLLGHPGGGALAVCGHVDRQWFAEGGLLEVALFTDVIGQLMNGATVGSAMQAFDQRYAVFAARISEMLRQRMAQGAVGGAVDSDLATLMTAMIDARNYIILGDPAVRLLLEGAPAGTLPPDTELPAAKTTAVSDEGPISESMIDDRGSRPRLPVTAAYAELQIRLRRLGSEGYSCDMRFSRPQEDAIFEWTDMRFTVDFARLLEVQSSDPHRYGQLLTEMLFVDAARNAFDRAQAVAAVQNTPLRISLMIAESAPELQALAWELIHDPRDPGSPLCCASASFSPATLAAPILFYARSSAPRPMRWSWWRTLAISGRMDFTHWILISRTSWRRPLWATSPRQDWLRQLLAI